MERAWVHGPDGWPATSPDGLLALLAAPEPPAAWVHVDSLDQLADAARQAGIPESVVRRSVAAPGQRDHRHLGVPGGRRGHAHR